MPLKVVIPQLGRFELIAQLLEAGDCEIVRLPAFEPGGPTEWSGEEIERYFLDADAFVGVFGPRPISRQVLEAATRLRVGASPIIGTESIDVEAATEIGIAIGYGAAPENMLGVAEAVVMLTAALLKNLPGKWDAVSQGGWRVDDPGHMVMNRTVGLIGLGNIGRATARRLQGWDCDLVGADPFVSSEDAAAFGVKLIPLDELMRVSDVVSIMVPLSASTHHLIGEHELSFMKPEAYLINTSRGPCVNEAALIKALDEGRIKGAAIDTWSRSRPAPTTLCALTLASSRRATTSVTLRRSTTRSRSSPPRTSSKACAAKIPPASATPKCVNAGISASPTSV